MSHNNFDQKKEKFRERADRLQLLFQWVKEESITYKQFGELVQDLQRIQLRAILDDSPN